MSTHIWTGDYSEKSNQRKRVVTWPSRVAAENPVKDLLETYRLLLPRKSVTPLVFNMPTKGEALDRLNEYVKRSAEQYNLPSLMLTKPLWTGEEFAQRLREGGFLGTKCYLTFAPSYIPVREICIFNFIPYHQLEVLNQQGKILLLHIPRDGRFEDAVNLAQMLEIEEKYPDIIVICIIHCTSLLFLKTYQSKKLHKKVS